MPQKNDWPLAPEPLADASMGEEIFNLLKRRGPLCASQIAVEIGRSLKNVTATLEGLRQEGVVQPRPDRDRSMLADEYETTWGLAWPSWFRKVV